MRLYELEADIRSFASQVNLLDTTVSAGQALTFYDRCLLNGLTDNMSLTLQHIIVLLQHLVSTGEAIEIGLL